MQAPVTDDLIGEPVRARQRKGFALAHVERGERPQCGKGRGAGEDKTPQEVAPVSSAIQPKP